MNFLRKHWYDLGGALALLTLAGVGIYHSQLTAYELLMWISLISLFLHQLEEYRIVGTFPGMVNTVMYNSDMPDRYPLNTHTAVLVNVWVGWGTYLLAALAGEKAIWLGLATILVSLGNTIAHVTVFNIRGKTLYNAGLITSCILFAPCVFFFFKITHEQHLITLTDYLIGIPLGIALNVFGILKLITWFADKETPYIFDKRHLLPRDRKI
ncbi:MAG: HXXEE domain-containing protein [Bacteroidia bacterium]|nr:HXXEE domain-containing protein [Bacteroidia bacterium]